MRRPRPSYANVISSIALFVALGGTGYAVTKLPRNSVGTTQLKANAVTSGKIRKGAVQRSDLAPSVRPGSGSGGSRGPRGPEGPAGPPGPSETVQVAKAQAVAIPTGAGGTATLATVTLAPGSWVFNAQTRVVSDGGSDHVDCFITTAVGERLGEGTVRIGNAAGETNAASIPTQIAVSPTTTTQFAYVCAHPSALAAGMHAERTWLIATRVGNLENR
ncbi:MAG: hypothetical protein QOJ85_423 [Solirubrobacteraceae bacterium]|jgi:hypothetical protein|nr:hypothetical protein [Solirubrobacteraceae bacterium]